MTDIFKTLDKWEAESNNAFDYEGIIDAIAYKRILTLTKALRMALESMRMASKSADAGYHSIELNAGIVTLSDDDFYSCVGYPRDALDLALKEIEAVMRGEG